MAKKLKNKTLGSYFFHSAIMLPKDLLGLVFGELDDGYDMLIFSEISRKCHQVFCQNIEVVRTHDTAGDPLIYMQHKLTKQFHGLYRYWWDKSCRRLYIEQNFKWGELHGQDKMWGPHGELLENSRYHTGIRIVQ